MAEMKSPKLLFVTTSLGTKWESYSQALIKRGYPSQPRLIVDGTRNWWPLMFLGPALTEDSDYIIHIDEDCFLYDPGQLDRLISHMEEDENVVLAGLPDGGNYYRGHNPYACNLFFIVFKTGPMRILLEDNPDWAEYRFKESFKGMSDLDTGSLDQSRVEYDDFEPYYGLFWMILESGKKIFYLNSSVNPDFLSTDLYMLSGDTPLARHMWYLRFWEMSELGPYDKVPNRDRYGAVEKDILLSFGSENGFRRTLWASNLARLAKGAIRKTSRQASRLVR